MIQHRDAEFHLSKLLRLLQFIRSFKPDDIPNILYIIIRETNTLNHKFLPCAKAEIGLEFVLWQMDKLLPDNNRTITNELYLFTTIC